MPLSYGKASQAQIATLDGRLQRLLHRYADLVDGSLDISVVCGHRGEAEQNRAFAEGKSKLQWPNSGHNRSPSLAVDVAPYINGKIDWDDTQAFLLRQGALRLVALMEKISLKPLISWDLPHIELTP